MTQYQVYVISAGRYAKLPFTAEQKKRFIFCVKNGEGDLYRTHGCTQVYETGRLVESRNFALDHAFKDDKICVQLSDDITTIKHNKYLTGHGGKIGLDDVVDELVQVFAQVDGVFLMGVPPTSNPLYAQSVVSKNSFCIGDLIFVKPCPLRFDTQLTLKEDYDYTLQHIRKYGACFRYQKYLFTFKHYKNKGGAVAYRTESEEKRNINYLVSKWNGRIRINTKRPNEILI